MYSHFALRGRNRVVSGALKYKNGQEQETNKNRVIN